MDPFSAFGSGGFKISLRRSFRDDQLVEKEKVTAWDLKKVENLELSWGTLPKTNSSHLKMDGWNTEYYLPFGLGLFSGAMLVSGRVHLNKNTTGTPGPGTHKLR